MMKNYFRQIFVLVLCMNLFTTINAQTSYSVGQIPYQVYTLSNPVNVGTMDDSYTASFSIPFNFNFFGVDYNSYLISTNGCVVFGNSVAPNSFAPYSLASDQTVPNTQFPVKNAVLGAFHDMNNLTNVGSIATSVVGAAPYRKLIVMFNNQPHYGNGCTNLRSTFQMVLHETFNFVDIQIKDKPICSTWNNGNAVSGIINEAGTSGFASHNTGQWEVHNQGWRYVPLTGAAANAYNYTICDDTNDGIGVFNLSVAQQGINLSNPTNVSFYLSLSDAQSNTNAIANLNFTNSVAAYQKIYARNGADIREVNLRVVNCAEDFDLDTVATTSEDLNGDTNLSNDDTDNDGIPNFVDNDDDGDIILTQYEYVSTGGRTTLDTDNDSIPNYLDNDDDGDGVPTRNEDYNGNFNPQDDDTNANGIADYLESGVALGVANFEKNQISIYPNPATSKFYIGVKETGEIKTVSIYAVNGQLVKSFKGSFQNEYDVNDLNPGLYLVKIKTDEGEFSSKMIKK